MDRLFSVRRRRPHVVDVWAPKVAGVDGYRLKWATNFDGSFTNILTATNAGYIDPNVNRSAIETQPLGDQVRIVFDPTTYSIPDGVSFWMKFVTVTGGVEGSLGAATLILPDSLRHQTKLIILAGTAPNVSAGSALQLDLPAMGDIHIVNSDTSRDLYVSVEAGGPEFTVPKGDAYIAAFSSFGLITSLYVRGNGGTVSFSLSGALLYSR